MKLGKANKDLLEQAWESASGNRLKEKYQEDKPEKKERNEPVVIQAWRGFFRPKK